MIIRKLTSADTAAHERVASQAFVYSCEPESETELPEENMLGAFTDDGILAADMEIGDRKCFFGNGLLKCTAIGGVAAKPEYRGTGAVKALFAEFDKNTDCDISILYPFSVGYYSKLGYSLTGLKTELSTRFSSFTSFEKNTDVILYEGSNTDKLVECYNFCASKYPLSFVRDNGIMFSDKPYADKKYTYIHTDKNGNYLSYATVSPDREKSTLFINELNYSDIRSLYSILGFLRVFEGNFENAVFCCLPFGSPVYEILSAKGECRCIVSRAGMIRIHNYESILKLKKYPQKKGSFTVCFEAADETYSVIYENGTGNVCRTDETPDIILGRDSAVKLLFDGIGDLSELEHFDDCRIVSRNPALCEAFGISYPFFCDNF